MCWKAICMDMSIGQAQLAMWIMGLMGMTTNLAASCTLPCTSPCMACTLSHLIIVGAVNWAEVVHDMGPYRAAAHLSQLSLGLGLRRSHVQWHPFDVSSGAGTAAFPPGFKQKLGLWLLEEPPCINMAYLAAAQLVGVKVDPQNVSLSWTS